MMQRFTIAARARSPDFRKLINKHALRTSRRESGVEFFFTDKI